MSMINPMPLVRRQRRGGPARFYVSLLPDSRVDKGATRAGVDYPSGKAGNVLVVEFTLHGPAIRSGLNGGPAFSSSMRRSRCRFRSRPRDEIERLTTNALSAVSRGRAMRAGSRTAYGPVLANRAASAPTPAQRC